MATPADPHRMTEPRPLAEPWAFVNGAWLPLSQVSISPFDTGFVQGVTVSEQLRTFNGVVFQFERHLLRLQRSLALVGINEPLLPREWEAVSNALVAHNRQWIPAGGDLGLTWLVTPGLYGRFAQGLAKTNVAAPVPDIFPWPHVEPRGSSTVIALTYPLAFAQWAPQYDQGVKLLASAHRQVGAESWSREIKCRSRMHYFLADQEVKRRNPEATALLLDQDGSVLETSFANLAMLTTSGEWRTPPAETVLRGVSLAYLRELVLARGQAWIEARLSIADLQAAAEVVLVSTPFSLLPAVEVGGESIGSGRPGPAYQQLLKAWSTAVGVEIATQAKQHQAPIAPGR